MRFKRKFVSFWRMSTYVCQNTEFDGIGWPGLLALSVYENFPGRPSGKSSDIKVRFTIEQENLYKDGSIFWLAMASRRVGVQTRLGKLSVPFGKPWTFLAAAWSPMHLWPFWIPISQLFKTLSVLFSEKSTRKLPWKYFYSMFRSLPTFTSQMISTPIYCHVIQKW